MTVPRMTTADTLAPGDRYGRTPGDADDAPTVARVARDERGCVLVWRGGDDAPARLHPSDLVYVLPPSAYRRPQAPSDVPARDTQEPPRD